MEMTGHGYKKKILTDTIASVDNIMVVLKRMAFIGRVTAELIGQLAIPHSKHAWDTIVHENRAFFVLFQSRVKEASFCYCIPHISLGTNAICCRMKP
jgi:hypothetical protein